MSQTSTITDYAREHGLNAADLAAIIHTDPVSDERVGDDPWGRRIHVAGLGCVSDGLYPVEYLDSVGASLDMT